MEAYELIIENKVKISPFDIVSLNDFQTHIGQNIDPHIVLEKPNLSLYCLDHANQRAIFIETLPMWIYYKRLSTLSLSTKTQKN